MTQPQPQPFREQMKALEHLQELDLKIDSLKKKKAALPVKMKALEDAFQKAKAASDGKKNLITEHEKTLRQTQAAIELNRDRLTRANQKLESVQNSQEFQAASKEIEQLRKMNLSLEDQIKKTKQEIEAGTQEAQKLDEELAKVKAERDAQASVVSGEAGQMDSEIAVLVAERSQYVNVVEKRIIALYDRVRVARGGLGLVPAVGGRCSGCNMMVPPQLYNEVQKATSVQACPSCHRILFVPAGGSATGASASSQTGTSANHPGV